MDHDGILGTGLVILMALVPVVAEGVSKEGAVAVEGGCLDGCAQSDTRLQTLTRVLVPRENVAIGARGGKGPMGGMEGDGIDGIDELVIAVAFKREIAVVMREREREKSEKGRRA